ncbi:hypothetical protein SRHO_G00282510 [Serrasalmus rhombeus]
MASARPLHTKHRQGGLEEQQRLRFEARFLNLWAADHQWAVKHPLQYSEGGSNSGRLTSLSLTNTRQVQVRSPALPCGVLHDTLPTIPCLLQTHKNTGST